MTETVHFLGGCDRGSTLPGGLSHRTVRSLGVCDTGQYAPKAGWGAVCDRQESKEGRGEVFCIRSSKLTLRP